MTDQARELDHLVAQDPDNFDHLVQAGNVQYDMGNFPRAAHYYERALEIREGSVDVLTDLGVCYRETQRAEQALEVFEQATRRAPEHWQSRYNGAIVRLFDLDDPAGAAQDLAELEKLKASNPEIPDLTGLKQEIDRRLK